MAAKRVMDVASDYQEPKGPAGNTQIKAIHKKAVKLKTGRLERDVDRLLEAKGLRLDETVPGTSAPKLRKASRA